VKIVSRLQDNRISAVNILIEMSLGEYADLVRTNLDKNEYQRKRVSSSQTVYSLLRADMLVGCVIPPVVLALNSDVNALAGESDLEVEQKIISGADNLVILDGLQRTHTILDLLEESADFVDDNGEVVRERKLRVEVYLGLNRLGILYRMLTLNTGQTPMSLRQQIEMLYMDYQDTSLGGGDVELLREAEGRNVSKLHQYNFKDVVEGFNSYLNRDASPIDRAGILENIRSLEKLSKENQDTEIFEEYVEVLDAFISRVYDLCGETQLPSGVIQDTTPFGKSVLLVFKKPQAMSGIGAALGKFIDREIIESLQTALEIIPQIRVEDPEDFLTAINDAMYWIKNYSSKIGTAQRSFFTFYFRELLNDDTDSYLDLTASATSALRKYQDQNA